MTNSKLRKLFINRNMTWQTFLYPNLATIVLSRFSCKFRVITNLRETLTQRAVGYSAWNFGQISPSFLVVYFLSASFQAIINGCRHLNVTLSQFRLPSERQETLFGLEFIISYGPRKPILYQYYERWKVSKRIWKS